MSKLIFLAGAALCFSGLCFGAPCVTGTLSSYIALGANGCTVGTNNLFDFQVLTVISGATAIPTANVSLTPLGGALDPGLTATVNATASSRNLLESLFTYKVSGNSYTSSSLTLAGSSQSGSGAVTGLENFCAGGTFGPSGVTGCTGVPGTLLTLNGVQPSDSRSFAAVSLLSITNDFTIDAGVAGTASGGTLTDRFTATAAVPEPVTFVLTALGIGLAASARKKFHGSKS